jgi:competence protein ComEC
MLGLVIVKRNEDIYKKLFMICADIFIFCIALNQVYTSNSVNKAGYIGNIISMDSSARLLVEVTDLPVGKEKFVKCNLRVLAVNDGAAFTPASGNIIGYFKNSIPAEKIEAGQVLLCSSKILELEGPKNPFEFDYRSYMANKQVHHITFIESNAFYITDIPSTSSSIWLYALKLKKYVLTALKNSSLSAEACAISEALLTGYSLDIDKNVMNAFAHSGTLHVLSVSGLHTGLIFLLLSFLFDLFDKRRKYKVAKFIFVAISLWMFALITGFSSPVLRAVIMFNLFGIGKLFFRNDSSNQLNILFVSAFILLMYDPFLLFDIGFQLSYSAMLGIFLFNPFFTRLYEPKNRLQEYIMKSFGASFAATVTTLPLTLLYFKQFPLWFFICNLVVVPATFVLLLLALLVVLKVPFVALIVNAITAFLMWFINMFDSVGTGYVANIHFEPIDAIFLSLLILFISLAVYLRSYRHCAIAVTMMIAWQLNGVFTSIHVKQQQLFTVYHIKKESSYSLKDKQQVFVKSSNSNNYDYSVLPHLVSFNYPDLSKHDFNFIKSDTEEIMILSKDKHRLNKDRKNITVLVLSNNYKLKRDDLISMKKLKRIICDGSNSKTHLWSIKTLCEQFNIAFYSTQANGAFTQAL